MDNLISRAAAIDAIVSVTAFPDAEYIKNLCQNPANSEDWLGGVCDAINAIEDMNAVDAVPIKPLSVWLAGYAVPPKYTVATNPEDSAKARAEGWEKHIRNLIECGLMEEE